MTADGSSPISSLVPNCNPPKAVTLALADGTLVPVLPPAKPVFVATPRTRPDFPQLLPPRRSFCPQKLITASSLVGNPVGLNVLLECVLVTKIGRGDPLCLLNRIPLPKD